MLNQMHSVTKKRNVKKLFPLLFFFLFVCFFTLKTRKAGGIRNATTCIFQKINKEAHNFVFVFFSTNDRTTVEAPADDVAVVVLPLADNPPPSPLPTAPLNAVNNNNDDAFDDNSAPATLTPT